MGKKSQIKAQRRAENIAHVQREREIAEVFGADTVYDAVKRYGLQDYQGIGTIAVPDCPVINVPTFTENIMDMSDNMPSDEFFEFMVAAFRDIKPPFREFFIQSNDIGATVESHEVNGFRDWHIYVMSRNRLDRDWVGLDDTVDLGHAVYRNDYDFGSSRIAIVDLYETLRLLQSSNIELVDKPPNSRLSEISEREFGRPLTTYKVLKVNTGHKEYRGQDKDTGLQDFDPCRMHVVRGHHAEYGTNGRKLHFGKYQRKVWIPAHVRGNEERGIVVKDYEVVRT